MSDCGVEIDSEEENFVPISDLLQLDIVEDSSKVIDTEDAAAAPYEEKTFECTEESIFQDMFEDVYLVRYLRLHCTVCDCHIGCAPSSREMLCAHPVLGVLICAKCKKFYESGEYPIDADGSEVFCRWCGQGGKLMCCCTCPAVFCKKCMQRNYVRPYIKEALYTDDWSCFLCEDKLLWELRAVCRAAMTYVYKEWKDWTQGVVPGRYLEGPLDPAPGDDPVFCCKLKDNTYKYRVMALRSGRPEQGFIRKRVINPIRHILFVSIGRILDDKKQIESEVENMEISLPSVEEYREQSTVEPHVLSSGDVTLDNVVTSHTDQVVNSTKSEKIFGDIPSVGGTSLSVWKSSQSCNDRKVHKHAKKKSVDVNIENEISRLANSTAHGNDVREITDDNSTVSTRKSDHTYSLSSPESENKSSNPTSTTVFNNRHPNGVLYDLLSADISRIPQNFVTSDKDIPGLSHVPLSSYKFVNNTWLMESICVFRQELEVILKKTVKLTKRDLKSDSDLKSSYKTYDNLLNSLKTKICSLSKDIKCRYELWNGPNAKSSNALLSELEPNHDVNEVSDCDIQIASPETKSNHSSEDWSEFTAKSKTNSVMHKNPMASVICSKRQSLDLINVSNKRKKLSLENYNKVSKVNPLYLRSLNSNCPMLNPSSPGSTNGDANSVGVKKCFVKLEKITD